MRVSMHAFYREYSFLLSFINRKTLFKGCGQIVFRQLTESVSYDFLIRQYFPKQMVLLCKCYIARKLLSTAFGEIMSLTDYFY